MPYKDRDARLAYQKVYQKAKGRRRKSRRKEDGLCLSCPRRAFPGRTLCRVCLLKAANRKARRRLLKREKGLCESDGCSDPAAPGFRHCPAHRERNRAYMAKCNAKRRGLASHNKESGNRHGSS